MKTLQLASLFTVLALMGFITPAPEAKADITIDFDTYAAIAYSPSTGAFGYGWNYGSRAAAERAALSECQKSDARIVGWVKGGWIALAVSDDNSWGIGYTYGVGASDLEAKQRALVNCPSRQGVRLVVCLCSGNVRPQLF